MACGRSEFTKIIDELDNSNSVHGEQGKLREIEFETSSIRPELDDSCYKINQDRPGYALVINNVDFDHMPPRIGSDVDDHNIKLLLRAYNFEIFEDKKTRNLTIAQMTDVLKRFAIFNDHGRYDCCIVIIMTHGHGGSLCATDWSDLTSSTCSINEEMILELFQGNKCVGLRGKPKLFFFQACRGPKQDTGTSYCKFSSTEKRTEDSLQQVNLDGNPKNCSSDGSGSFDSDVKSRISSHSDFFVGHSTVPGFKSYRLQHGSFFINMILLVFQKYSHSDDLLSMMTCVNRSVQERLDAFNEKFVSISSQRHTLTRKFYFPMRTNPMMPHCGKTSTKQKAQTSATTETELLHDERHTESEFLEETTEKCTSRRRITEKEIEVNESKPSSSRNGASPHNEVLGQQHTNEPFVRITLGSIEHADDVKKVTDSIELFSLCIMSVLSEKNARDSSDSSESLDDKPCPWKLVDDLIKVANEYVKKVIPQTTTCLTNLLIICQHRLAESFDDFRGGNQTCIAVDIEKTYQKLGSLGALNLELSEFLQVRSFEFKKLSKDVKVSWDKGWDAVLDATHLRKLPFRPLIDKLRSPVEKLATGLSTDLQLVRDTEQMLNLCIIPAHGHFETGISTISKLCFRLIAWLDHLHNIKGNQRSDYKMLKQVVQEVNSACKAFLSANFSIEKQLRGISELDD